MYPPSQNPGGGVGSNLPPGAGPAGGVPNLSKLHHGEVQIKQPPPYDVAPNSSNHPLAGQHPSQHPQGPPHSRHYTSPPQPGVGPGYHNRSSPLQSMAQMPNQIVRSLHQRPHPHSQGV